MTAIVRTDGDPNAYVMPADASAVERARLPVYVRWLDDTGRRWDTPDLKAYRDWLIAQRYSPATVAAYLVTVRARYRAILRDNALMLAIMQAFDGSPADQWAAYSAWRQAIENAIDPDESPVRVPTRQDYTDDERRWITVDQAKALVSSPRAILERQTDVKMSELRAARDETILYVMLLTGIRREELTSLTVADTRRTVDKQRGMHIRDGKGAKARFVFYGEYAPILRRQLDDWLRLSGVRDVLFPALRPPLFDVLRDTPMSLKSVNDLLAYYPIEADGKWVTLKPHDTRRFYAKLLRDSGMELDQIAKQLGHASVQTLIKNYLPPLDVARRLPKAIW